MNLLNIYFGTKGIASYYLKDLIEVQKKVYNNVYSLVSFHAFLDDAIKLVYPISDSDKFILSNNTIRYIIRYIELLIGLTVSIFIIKLKNINQINYSVTLYNNVEYTFLKFIVFLYGPKTDLLLTIHDANLHENKYLSKDSREEIRKKIIDLADKVIVHNEHSKDLLLASKLCKIDKIYCHLFPTMTFPHDILIGNISKKAGTYVFLGHGRKEKGIEFLCNSWKELDSAFLNNNTLIVKGSDPFGILKNLKIELINSKSIVIKDGFISDYDFIKTLQSSEYLILPYFEGTNSGIPFLALSCGTIPLMSDIPAFSFFSNNYPNLVFKKGDRKSFEHVIKNLENESNSRTILDEYSELFRKSTHKEYLKIIKANASNNTGS